MRITLAHHTRLPVRGYGGTERVVVALARGLAELGHEVSLIAPPGTRVPEATLVPVEAAKLRHPEFEIAPLIPVGSEILHAFYPLRRPPDFPWVWTLEGTTRPGVTRPPNTIYVSADHAARHGSRSFVYNGIDPADFTFQPVKEDYDLFLGRLHESKGWQLAAAGAKLAERRVVIAGGWRPSLSKWIRFVGTVDGAEKAKWLAGARLLWMPAQWDEPFGLTLIEALWSGTPVLGTRRGSLPEVLSSAVAEFGDTLEELVAALPAMASKDPHACRARAEQYFSHRQMAEGYHRCYKTFLSTRELPEGTRAGE